LSSLFELVFHIIFLAEYQHGLCRFYDSVLNMFEIDNDDNLIKTDFAMDSTDACNIQVSCPSDTLP